MSKEDTQKPDMGRERTPQFQHETPPVLQLGSVETVQKFDARLGIEHRQQGCLQAGELVLRVLGPGKEDRSIANQSQLPNCGACDHIVPGLVHFHMRSHLISNAYRQLEAVAIMSHMPTCGLNPAGGGINNNLLQSCSANILATIMHMLSSSH